MFIEGMYKLQAMGVSPKHNQRYYVLKHYKGSGAQKMLTPAEMARQDKGEGARPRHALKFKM